jgi:hypothetical protein
MSGEGYEKRWEREIEYIPLSSNVVYLSSDKCISPRRLSSRGTVLYYPIKFTIANCKYNAGA